MGSMFGGGAPDTSAQEAELAAQKEKAEAAAEKLKKEEAAKRRSSLGSSRGRSLLTGAETGTELKKTLG